MNVRFGSLADISRTLRLCLLSGVERTSPLATPVNESTTQPDDPAIPAHAGPWSDDRSGRHIPAASARIAMSGARVAL